MFINFAAWSAMPKNMVHSWQKAKMTALPVWAECSENVGWTAAALEHLQG